MSARDAVPVKTEQDLADDHDLRLHRAMLSCRMVGYKGLNRFIGGFCHHQGDREMVVYLTGSSDPVRPCELTILEVPK